MILGLGTKQITSAAVIHTRSEEFPSDYSTQPCAGQGSTTVGDHVGILGAAVVFFPHWPSTLYIYNQCGLDA